NAKKPCRLRRKGCVTSGKALINSCLRAKNDFFKRDFVLTLRGTCGKNNINLTVDGVRTSAVPSRPKVPSRTVGSFLFGYLFSHEADCYKAIEESHADRRGEA